MEYFLMVVIYLSTYTNRIEIDLERYENKEICEKIANARLQGNPNVLAAGCFYNAET